MPFQTANVNVTDVAGGVALGSGANESGVLVVNKHATASIWLHGPETASAGRVAAAGFELKAGESIEVALTGRADRVFAVAGAAVVVPVELARS